MTRNQSLIFFFLVTFSLFFFDTRAFADEVQGSWGNVPWTFETTTGTLTFNDGGTLASCTSSPWNRSEPNKIDYTAIEKIIFTDTTFAPPNSVFLFGTMENATGLTSLSAIEGLYFLDTRNVTDMEYMFNFIGISSLNLSNFDTSNVTNMYGLFANAQQLTSLDVSSFDTSKVTDFTGMFYYNYKLEALNLSNFNTSKATTMENMFNSVGITSLNLSNFDTSNVTDMYGLFANTPQLTSLDVSSFDTSNVTDMYGLFANAVQLTSLDVSSFDISKVTNFDGMFFRAFSLQELTLGNISLSPNMLLPKIDISSGEYTGGWICISDNNDGKLYNSSIDLVTTYSSDYAGTYIWERSKSLIIKNSTIRTTDNWSIANNFVSATDNKGVNVDFDAVTASGSVDTKKAGTYEITYTYGPLTKVAIVTVEDVPATLTVEFIQGKATLSDYTITLDGYNVWSQVSLIDNDVINATINELKSKGYNVQPPSSTTISLKSVNETVQYSVTGALNLSVPSVLDFGSLNYSGIPQTLSASAIGSLTVTDTLNEEEKKGWSVYVTISKPLTNNVTTTQVPGGIFSYVNSNSNSILLSSINQLIASSLTGGNQKLSDNWGTDATDEGIKLTLDETVGAGNYSAELTWTLQVGPES